MNIQKGSISFKLLMNLFNVMITCQFLTKYTQSSYSPSHVIRVEFQKYPVQQYKPEGLTMNKKYVLKYNFKNVFRCFFQTLHYFYQIMIN